MKNNPPLTKSNYPKEALFFLDAWYILILKKDYAQAESNCNLLINQLALLLKERPWELDENGYNQLLYIAVAIKALKDFVDIGKIVNQDNWSQNNSLVELLWIKHWDCRERLNFITQVESPVLTWAKSRLDSLYSKFTITYGHGIYSSPEILIKKEFCSICKLDIRACSHIQGSVYDGRICKGKVDKMELKSISLVEVPKDPRCRLWPWQSKDGRTFETRIMNIFSIDDFLYEYEK